MSLQEEIQTILKSSLSYDEKGTRLAKLITKQELKSLLPEPKEEIRLKEPLKPKTTGMRTLLLSIHNVYFDQILRGTKKIEYRDYKDYYIEKCTYTEGGKRYLVPYDAITLFVGRGANAKSATVALTDITCNGVYFMFHLGKVLYKSK